MGKMSFNEMQMFESMIHGDFNDFEHLLETTKKKLFPYYEKKFLRQTKMTTQFKELLYLQQLREAHRRIISPRPVSLNWEELCFGVDIPKGFARVKSFIKDLREFETQLEIAIRKNRSVHESIKEREAAIQKKLDELDMENKILEAVNEHIAPAKEFLKTRKTFVRQIRLSGKQDMAAIFEKLGKQIEEASKALTSKLE